MPGPVQSTCPECGKVYLKRNLWTHLTFVHRRTKQDILRIREQINTETGVNKVTCPLCEGIRFATFKHLAQHCQQTHAENGAGGRPQDYNIFSLKFDNEQQYTTCAIIETKATSLAKVDTDEAVSELKEALAHLQLAVEAMHGPETASPVARPEMMGIEAKPKLSKVPLCQRGKLKNMNNKMLTINDDDDGEDADADH
ncbi:unnamed protein product [Nippostrongylus brasiliensis]|uniref:C2H2-type domain-containing protein n=1 Tax=Nippostrongylus brasiliensis TaxID=27835 RepID=A0A0N4YCI9_NIPBR|nr:unnamed protein product [Nippostrongylus brasiliensis]